MITKVAPTSDLSLAALEDAVTALPPTKLYRLQINPKLLVHTQELLRKVAKEVEGNNFAPHFSIELSPAIHEYGWALWSGDACIWSPGT